VVAAYLRSGFDHRDASVWPVTKHTQGDQPVLEASADEHEVERIGGGRNDGHGSGVLGFPSTLSSLGHNRGARARASQLGLMRQIALDAAWTSNAAQNARRGVSRSVTFVNARAPDFRRHQRQAHALNSDVRDSPHAHHAVAFSDKRSSHETTQNTAELQR
jgi:hypothetical protein